MSEVQYSDDGQWWWDEAAQQWQPVAAPDGQDQPGTAEEAPVADAGVGGPLATLDAAEASSYFQQSLDAGMSEVYEA